MSRTQTASAFTIDGKQLVEPKVIRTKSGLTSSIGFHYNLFSLIDSNRSSKLFEYNKDTQVLRFPIVVEDKRYPLGKVTHRFIEYKYDGAYFQRVKN